MKGLREIANDNAAVTTTGTLFDKPFPNLRTREIVKEIVEGIVETVEQTKMTPEVADQFALGLIRGARIVAEKIADDTTRLYVATLLDVLKNGGLPAINRLVEIVTGEPLTAAA